MNPVSGGGARARALDCISACSPDLLAYFERRTASADAADLLSETMLTAWRRIDDLPKDDKFILVSTRGVGLPTTRKCFGFLSAGDCGTGSFAAAAVSSP